MRQLATGALMMICAAAIGQDMSTTIAKKFNDYREKHLTLKTAVAFSQDKYVPGDTAFFHAWFVTDAGQLVGGQQILNMDMVDANGKVVANILFRVVDGVGGNQMIIPSGLSPGVYTMSVYSEAMKGVDAGYTFRKPISIVRQNEIAADFTNKAVTSEYIRVDTTSKENINVSLAIPNQKEKDLVFVLTSDGQLHYTAAFDFKKRDRVNIKLPRKDVPMGWNQISVVDKDGAVVAVHQFYIPLSIRCSIELTQFNYQTGQQVYASVKTFDKDGVPISLPVSVSVLNDNLSYGPTDKLTPHAPPLLPWDVILSGKIPVANKPPKKITMYGEAYDSETNKPVKGGTIINAFMKKNRFAFETTVEHGGRVELLFSDFFDKDEMFYYAEKDHEEVPNVKIRWTTEDMVHAPAPRSRQISGVDNYAKFIDKKRLVDRSYNYFLSDTTKAKEPKVTLEKFFEPYGDIRNLHDYKIFPTMKEILVEVVPRLRTTSHGEVRVSLSDPESKRIEATLFTVDVNSTSVKSIGTPLFIIDNATTKDSETFLALNPEDVVSIRVIHRIDELQKFLPISRNGIVVVTTKNAAKRRINENVIPITGLTAPINFVHQSNKKPEFRSTLYWNLITTSQLGTRPFSFLTSEDPGKMRIRVTGVYGGEIFTAEKEIIVNFK